MKKLYGSFAAKLIAVILLCLLALVFVGSNAGTAAVYSGRGYTESYREFRNSFLGDEARNKMRELGNVFMDTGSTVYYSEDPNLRVVLLSGSGEELWSDYEGEETIWEGAEQIFPNYSIETATSTLAIAGGGEIEIPAASEPGESTEEKTLQLRDYRSGKVYSFTDEEADAWIRENTAVVKGYVLKDLQQSGSLWTQAKLASFLYSGRFAFLWALGLSFLAGVLVFIFLLCAAGHRKDTDGVVRSFVDKIPFDVFTLLIVAAMGLCILPMNYGFDWPEGLMLLIPIGLLMGLLLLLWSMSLAVRVKTDTLWSNTLVGRFFGLFEKGMRVLPILWKWALGIGLLALIDLALRRSAVLSYTRTTFWWLLFWILAGGATLYAALAFRRLRMGAKEIADGNLSYTVDDGKLLGDLKDHAHDLNRIRDGLNNAVEERMKSERFRTELITNVSHDIKTPLTSIVNYVDLLQREEPENEKQREYLEVLSRQSSKLKKLIEDLIEASKASTGNLNVVLEPCELGVLLDQTAGEYAEKLEAAGLDLVVQKPETPVCVMADGRQLWRIFDNLLNNIVKYAMPGTRVYLNLTKGNGKARVSFRNISREALNISAEELTERFVRGDSSRNTEGSGLGLSIAMSLTRLQKGEMDIDVDGDLFKVTLCFDTTE